jgi:hypothetical protein
LDGLAGRFLIPKSLTELFDDASTYAEGARCLEYLGGHGLLMPVSLAGAVDENASLADYEKTARVYCYGHSPKMLETIDELLGELRKIGREYPDGEFRRAANAATALEDARTRKITDAERGYIMRLSELFERRREMKEQKRESIVMWGAAAFALCAAARAALGMIGYVSDEQWVFSGITTLFITGTLLHSALGGYNAVRRDFDRWRELARNDPYNQNPFRRNRDPDLDEWGETRPLSPSGIFYQITAIYGAGVFLALFHFLRFVMPSITRILSLAFPIYGAFAGAGISYWLYNFRMRRLLREIDRACALLRAGTERNDERDV